MSKPAAAETTIAFSPHDHSHCSGDLLATAQTLADARGARLTPVRRRVLEILLEAHRALGAYEVLERLAADGYGNQPPVAYRALDFLVEQGLAHRIDRLNAFMACTHPADAHNPVFFICRHCHTVAEAAGPLVRAAVADTASGIGFVVERLTVEVSGLCPACQTVAA